MPSAATTTAAPPAARARAYRLLIAVSLASRTRPASIASLSPAAPASIASLSLAREQVKQRRAADSGTDEASCNPICDLWPPSCVRPLPCVLEEGTGELRRLGDLNPGRARTLTALAVRRHRPD